MKEIFAKILAVDERAKKIAEDNGLNVIDADAEISIKTEELKNKTDSDMYAEIEAETKKCRCDAEKRISEINTAVDKQKEKLAETVRANTEKWVNETVAEIVG